MMLKIRYSVMCTALVAAAVLAIVAGRAVTAAAEEPSSAAEKERKLISVLESNVPPQDKAIPCKQLAIYGTKNAVPALAALLSDAELSSWARIALEAIPDPAAGDALCAAMDKLQGRLLIGVINSIGVRRDAQAVDGLVKRLKDGDAEVASAAAVALGRIGGDRPATVLHETLREGPTALRNAAAQGCILCAEKSLAAGNRAEAIKLYDTVRQADVPKQRLLEGIRGAILARQADGVPLLVEQLKSADKALLGIGLTVARELPGREATEALVAELGKVPPDRQGLLVLALADRGDAAAMPALVEAAKGGPKNLRSAAISVLERLGNASCVPVLLDAAVEDDVDVAETAKTALEGLPGSDVDTDLVARLPQAKGKMRLVLLALAGQRRIAAALPALLKAADDSDAEVRCAAVTALGNTVELGDLSVLIGRVIKSPDPQETKAAEEALSAACVRMPDREACAGVLVAAMPQAAVPAKCRFIEVLSAMGGPKALAAVGAAAKDANPEVQDAASRLLGEWMTADAGPVLLDLAKTVAEAKYKTRALRGYLRIARQLDLPAAERVAMCREAAKLCQRDEEKRLVLEVLARNPSADGLSLALPYLRSGTLKKEASSAAVSIGEKIVQGDPATVADAMQEVLDAGPAGDLANRAKAVLEQARKASGKK